MTTPQPGDRVGTELQLALFGTDVEVPIVVLPRRTGPLPEVPAHVADAQMDALFPTSGGRRHRRLTDGLADGRDRARCALA